MTQTRKDSSKKKLKPNSGRQVSLPLVEKTKKQKIPQSKIIFQLKSELHRHQQRDREWKLMFSMLAHDLKEPLLTLEGFTQLLEDSGLQTKDQKKYLKVIREAVGSLHLLIGSLQSITKLYQEPSNQIDISLKQMLESVINALSEQIKRNKGKIVLPKNDVIIKGDPARLYQILLNLIANSLKYHQVNMSPQIIVKYRKEAAFHKISIQDNGVGISQKDMERIFTPFMRLEEVMADGLGLGLSIVKRIAETCGGRINVRSQRNKGTTFSIYLPREIQK